MTAPALAILTPHPAESLAALLAKGTRREVWTVRRRLALMRGKVAVFILGPREEPTRCVLLGERKGITVGRASNADDDCYGTRSTLELVLVEGEKEPRWVCGSRRKDA